MKTELLSPAGDIEAAYSAFYFGADAIYLGLRRFSARAEAVNFSPEDLDEITAYAHANGKKVYVAINTLMQENELPELMTHLQVCADCKVDALIVQDMGVARLVKKAFPSLVLHASTQMAIHSLAGALALKKLGFERVVLARELSLNEIRKIQQESGLEVEVFIHGALCYSYSGLCYFSSMTTGRSANRGKCVYSCRDTFRMNGRQYHPFSMKDLALEKEACQLQGLSLKIEGRKKTALYVGAVTDYYRRVLDTGKTDVSLTDNMKQIFARPWTKLHFNGKNKDVIEPDFVGHRGLPIGKVEKIFNGQITFKPSTPIARYDGLQIDIAGVEKPFGFSVEKIAVGGKNMFEAEARQTVTVDLPPKSPFIQKGSTVYLASSTRVKGSYPYAKPKKGAYKNRVPVVVGVYIDETGITAYVDDVSVRLDGAFEPAKDVSKMATAIDSCFHKTGDTIFDVTDIMIQNPNGLFVPMSVLNEVRRQLFEALTIAQTASKEVPVIPMVHLKKEAVTSPKWRLKTDDLSVLQQVDLATIDEVIFEITPRTTVADLALVPADKIRLALPTVIRTNAYQKTIDMLFGAGYTKWQIGNWGGLQMLPKKADVDFDYTMPVLNTQAASMLFDNGASGVTLSVEDTGENMRQLLKKVPHATVIVYQDTPLFLSANCIRPNGCADCSHQTERYELSNGKDKFEAVSKECVTTVMKAVPYYIGDSMRSLSGAEWLRMDFCTCHYTPEQVNRLVRQIQSRATLRQSYTGNFKKSFA